MAPGVTGGLCPLVEHLTGPTLSPRPPSVVTMPGIKIYPAVWDLCVWVYEFVVKVYSAKKQPCPFKTTSFLIYWKTWFSTDQENLQIFLSHQWVKNGVSLHPQDSSWKYYIHLWGFTVNEYKWSTEKYKSFFFNWLVGQDRQGKSLDRERIQSLTSMIGMVL